MFTLYVYCANCPETKAFVSKIGTNSPQPLVYLKMFFCHLFDDEKQYRASFCSLLAQ